MVREEFQCKSFKPSMKLILVLLFPILATADPASSLAGKNTTLRDEKGRSSTTASTSGATTTFRDAREGPQELPHDRTLTKRPSGMHRGERLGDQAPMEQLPPAEMPKDGSLERHQDHPLGLTTYRDSSGK